MTGEEIESIISDFASAARRAREAGFDALQFHGAHGYLMSQFLSPQTNHRTDKWGGSAEDRRRFHLEVIRKVRQAVGVDFPVMIKLGVKDESEKGLPLNEALETARQMAEAGIDAIEVSGAVPGAVVRAHRKGDPEEPYFRESTAAVKRVVDVPVMAVGGIRSLEMAQNIVDNGHADLISMCRPFIREPDLIARWQKKDKAAARCASCNKCGVSRVEGGTLECVEEHRLREKKSARA
jgi:2,4-dienoyl-CoA reductase-like NADH-dependent reductase (Old Yellow Enzyme family)